MIKLVVFDWNGTLLADVQAILEGVNKEMEVLDHTAITLKEYRDKYDVPLSEFYKNLGIDRRIYTKKALQVAQAFHAYYEPRVAKARTRGGAKQLLDSLARQNISQIILSNHTLEGIYLQLERLKLGDYFDAVLANEEIHLAQTTGKQDRLHNYIKAQNILPSQVAIVGDTTEDIKIGKNLGLKTIALKGGYNSTSRLNQAKPDAIINKLSELTTVLQQL